MTRAVHHDPGLREGELAPLHGAGLGLVLDLDVQRAVLGALVSQAAGEDLRVPQRVCLKAPRALAELLEEPGGGVRRPGGGVPAVEVEPSIVVGHGGVRCDHRAIIQLARDPAHTALQRPELRVAGEVRPPQLCNAHSLVDPVKRALLLLRGWVGRALQRGPRVQRRLVLWLAQVAAGLPALGGPRLAALLHKVVPGATPPREVVRLQVAGLVPPRLLEVRQRDGGLGGRPEVAGVPGEGPSVGGVRESHVPGVGRRGHHLPIVHAGLQAHTPAPRGVRVLQLHPLDSAGAEVVLRPLHHLRQVEKGPVAPCPGRAGLLLLGRHVRPVVSHKVIPEVRVPAQGPVKVVRHGVHDREVRVLGADLARQELGRACNRRASCKPRNEVEVDDGGALQGRGVREP